LLRVDGRTIIRVRSGTDAAAFGKIRLTAGLHPVQLTYDVTPPSPGGLEWSWIPPGGAAYSIVPPRVLEPPPGAGVAPPVALAKLGAQPVETPLAVVR
jgi:hypothetical protein